MGWCLILIDVIFGTLLDAKLTVKCTFETMLFLA